MRIGDEDYELKARLGSTEVYESTRGDSVIVMVDKVVLSEITTYVNQNVAGIECSATINSEPT